MGGQPRKPAAPTIFDGITFRSRLEAHWAAFFKATGTRYEYEKFTFKLPKLNAPEKTCEYTPDFYLPDFGIWIEVKGLPLNALEAFKGQNLAHNVKPDCVFVYVGYPVPNHNQNCYVLEMGRDGVKDEFSWGSFFEEGSGLSGIDSWFPYVSSENVLRDALKAGRDAFKAPPRPRKALWAGETNDR